MNENDLLKYVKNIYGEIPEQGNFNPLGKDSSIEFNDGYKATMKTPGAWEWMKTKKKGWGINLPEDAMSKKMQSEITKNLEFKNHSLCSFIVTMKNIEYIAKEGWVKYLAIIYINSK